VIDVVVVAYRCEEPLRECLGSLRENPGAEPLRIHVLDNASGDGTAVMVEREFPEVTLTVADKNLGFSAANNLAIRSGSAEWVWVLNPDTRVLPGAIDTLREALEANERAGMVGPKLELPDGTFDHAARRSFPTPISALGHFTGVGRRRESGALAAYRAPEVDSGPVDAINGACMFIRRSALNQVGLFDEGYWMYMEDLDLCYRFAKAGWLTLYEPRATVIHVKGYTTGTVRPPRLNRAFHYGMYRFYRDHYAPGRNPLVNASVYAGIVAKLGVSLTRNAVRASLLRRHPRHG
jgi:GT2 family glycosyltransferase